MLGFLPQFRDILRSSGEPSGSFNEQLETWLEKQTVFLGSDGADGFVREFLG